MKHLEILPDVIFVDGGITQIHAAKTSCSRIKTEITNLWNGKDDKHSTRALINENREEIPLSEELMKLITYFQDCIHDKAISYHRKLRDKEMTKSELDIIEGIGKIEKMHLLKKFGSVAKIKRSKCRRNSRSFRN